MWWVVAFLLAQKKRGKILHSAVAAKERIFWANTKASGWEEKKIISYKVIYHLPWYKAERNNHLSLSFCYTQTSSGARAKRANIIIIFTYFLVPYKLTKHTCFT